MTDTPSKIFVKGLNWVGDAVMATPALRHLRRSMPEARITLMVRPWVAPVYEHNPDIDELWSVDESASLRAFARAVGRVRRERFDLGIALPNSWRSALLLAWGDVPRRIGLRRRGRGVLLNYSIRLRPELTIAHQVYTYLALLETLCGPPPSQPRLVLNAGELEREEIRHLLAQRGLDRGQPVIALAPGSINSIAKRWPAERYAQLAERLAAEYDGAEMVLIGSAAEKDVLDEVETRTRAPIHNLGGLLSLGQAIALLARLDALVCNDAGAMHMAAALGVPTAAVFGPTEWDTTYPFSTMARVVRAEAIECAPCMLRECPFDHRCMTEVTVERVAQTVDELMSARTR